MLNMRVIGSRKPLNGAFGPSRGGTKLHRLRRPTDKSVQWHGGRRPESLLPHSAARTDWAASGCRRGPIEGSPPLPVFRRRGVTAGPHPRYISMERRRADPDTALGYLEGLPALVLLGRLPVPVLAVDRIEQQVDQMRDKLPDHVEVPQP